MFETSFHCEVRPNATRAALHRSRSLTSTRWLRIAATLAASLMWACVATAQSPGTETLALKTNWQIQSSARILGGGGNAISQPGFYSPDWYPATVPTTIVAALVDDKIYSDPYYAMALRSLPGVKYKIGDNFSDDEMPKDSPFRVSWWYRTQFTEPADWQGKSVWLNFRGINYRANI
ncbi:MAG TPA: hypothetical protein VEJ39_09425, partial [Candidatus Acidoferrales bacterium]|nr:hypothetical protein [Candidatus Acidoferrales bacterium]